MSESQAVICERRKVRPGTLAIEVTVLSRLRRGDKGTDRRVDHQSTQELVRVPLPFLLAAEVDVCKPADVRIADSRHETGFRMIRSRSSKTFSGRPCSPALECAALSARLGGCAMPSKSTSLVAPVDSIDSVELEADSSFVTLRVKRDRRQSQMNPPVAIERRGTWQGAYAREPAPN
jgi:hypothetical protein